MMWKSPKNLRKASKTVFWRLIFIFVLKRWAILLKLLGWSMTKETKCGSGLNIHPAFSPSKRPDFTSRNCTAPTFWERKSTRMKMKGLCKSLPTSYYIFFCKTHWINCLNGAPFWKKECFYFFSASKKLEEYT